MEKNGINFRFLGLLMSKHNYRLLMRLSFTLVFSCFISIFASTDMTYSQNRVTLDFSDTPLYHILAEIENQSDYSFVYKNNEVDSDRLVNIRVEEKELQEVLKQLFNKTEIIHTFKKNRIVLHRETELENGQQKTYTISGTLKDTDTGETLLGANIIVKNQNKGVVTNEYGFYSITLPEGEYVLIVSYIGYKSKEIEVELHGNQQLFIELDTENEVLDEIILVSDNYSKSQVNEVQTSVSTIKTAEIKKMPSLLGEPDITRALLTQPGVTSIGEGTSGFNVRGGNIDQNLILLDEAPIYNSSHLWGFFSVFNADAIKDLKLYKGGIPARFGGRGSSVLDIRQKEGSSRKFIGEGGIGLLFSRLTLESPIIKDKLSFLVSGRRSYFDLFFPLLGGELKGNKIYFYDLNTKLSWNINKRNKLYFSGYFGADVMKLKFDDDIIYDDNGDELATTNFNIDFSWKNATAAVRWNHIFSDKLFYNLSAIYSKYDYQLDTEEASGPGSSAVGFNWGSSIQNWILKSDFTLFKNIDTKWRFGLNGIYYLFEPANISGSLEGINSFNLEPERAYQLDAYTEYHKKWGNLSINAGLRASIFSPIGKRTVSVYDPERPRTVKTIVDEKEFKSGESIKTFVNFEPRLSLNYKINERNSIKLGYDRVFQYTHLISNTYAAIPFDIWKPSGYHVDPLEVNQISIGYAYDTKNHKYNFTFGGYYKDFKNLIEYKNGADLFVNEHIETQLLNAKGYAYGAEFGLHKNKGRFQGNINYTYSVSKRKSVSPFASENINNGDFYPANYDRPHVFNTSLNYTLNKKWSISSYFTYQTGRPITYPTGSYTIGQDIYFTYSSRNKFRLSDTHRLDISFTYNPESKRERKWDGSWSFGVYNVYGHKNAFSVNSSVIETATGPEIKVIQFSVIGNQIPFINYNFKF